MSAAVRKAPRGVKAGRRASATRARKAAPSAGKKSAAGAPKAGRTRSRGSVICVKRHCTGSEILIAACDQELLGKCFVDGEVRLDVCNSFYDGEKVDIRLFLETLSLATIANLVGRDTVAAAIEAGFVDPSCVIRIKGVPHAQLFRL